MTLYDQFREQQLPPGNESPIQVQIAHRSPEVPPDLEFAERVVGRLLSGGPVCIIDANAVDMHDRLRFIDGVMALLPYGLRSRMSASTWTTSTHQRHKFRLFFSNSPRVSLTPKSAITCFRGTVTVIT